jgi:eukaryotic-like serine/threonine-protein kinase
MDGDRRRISHQPGAMLGGYRIERMLGRGGMGAVFLAYDTTLHRRVALKIIDGESDGEASRVRVLREARNAAALNHPNICTVYEVGEADGDAFIAMEFVEGQSLRDRLDDSALPEDAAVRLAIQAADALAYAHEGGVVHRDFKAANVIVTSTGRLKIVDFGLARRVDASMASMTTMGSLVAAGVAAGTPYAMAPEQVRGDSADARSDIWALGVLIYEMIAGSQPFRSPTIPELFSSILRDPPAPLPPVTSAAIRDLIDRCLEKDAGQRYQHAREVHAALEAIHTGQFVPTGRGRRQLATMRQPRRLALGAGLVAAAGLVGLIGLLVGGRIGGLRDVFTGAATESGPVTLAVLPFQNLTGDPGQEYFTDGLTEEMLIELSRVQPRALRVIARAAAMPYKDRRAPLADIGRALGAAYVLDGSARREGERIRITAALIRVRDQTQLWADRYERDLRDAVRLQGELAVEIARQLRVELTAGSEALRAAQRRQVHPGAYDHYLRGRTRLERVNRADTEAAIVELEQAVALDPMFADAFGALAAAYGQMYGSYAPEQGARLEPKARAAIDQAFSLDPNVADAHAAQGNIIWNAAHGWPHEDAAQAYRSAIALRPNFDRAHRALSVIFNHVGLADAALREAGQSDDSPASLFQKGLAMRILGRQDDALALWLEIPSSSRNTSHIGHIAWVLSDLGRSAEAWNQLRPVLSAGTADVNGMLAAVQALLHAAAGERAEAEKWIPVATARASATSESHHATYIVAAAYARLGQREEAVRWLRYTATNGYPCYPLMASDGHFESLRSYGPFVEFLQELRARWEGYRTRLGGSA